ncbi:MAG: PASTA domain-containing protein [Melioribacteraceae bacterium]|nr:PASTA domain-containing protein [Melioribacteraceae bacterium]
MKNTIKKLFFSGLVGIIIIGGTLLLFDNFYMPWYVSAEEIEIPDVLNWHKDDAIKKLTDLGLNPVLQEPRYDARYEADHVMFQNPSAGKTVKKNRRIYLLVSGGEPMVKMPNLRQKTSRDAMITLQRLGLFIRDLEEVKSDLPADIIVEQEFEEGTLLARGDSVDLKISIGPRIGMIAVPNIIARSVSEADKMLRRNNLKLGIQTYVESTLLTNTIIDQSPPEGTLLNIGDSVNVWVAKSN